MEVSDDYVLCRSETETRQLILPGGERRGQPRDGRAAERGHFRRPAISWVSWSRHGDRRQRDPD